MKSRSHSKNWSALLAISVGGCLAAFPWMPQARAANTDVWTDQSGDNLWNTTSTNWLVNGVAGMYTNGDSVIFNDSSGPGHYNVTIPALVSPLSVTVNNSAGNYLFGGAGAIGGAGGLTKLGSGQLTLLTSATNSYAGNTSLLQGTTVLNFTGLSTPTNLINPPSALVLGGGKLSVLGKASGSTAQTFNGTMISSGASAVSANNSGGTGTTVSLGTIARNTGGTVDFTLPGGSGAITAVNANSNQILGGYATVAGATWAVSGGNGSTAGAISAFSAYVTTWTATNTNNIDVTGTLTPNADTTTNSLRFNTSGSFNVTLSDTSSSFNTILSGGILVTSSVGANNNTITGGLLTSGNGKDLIVLQNNSQGSLTIASQIVNNGATPIGFTESGPGAVGLSGPNTYTGVTTINGGVVSVSSLATEGAGGGTASGIGQSGNASANLVLNQGTLQYTGTGGSTDRLLTLGPGGGTLDASGSGAITFVGNGAGSANAIAFSQDTPAVFTLTGSNTGSNTFAPIISDPDTSHQYTTSVVKSGAGTWILTNANSYTGGTTVNGGALKVNNVAGSGTGTGPVIINAGASLGGSGSVGGPVTINSGATLAPGDATAFTINNNLTLAIGALGSYAFNVPNTPGTGGGNDITNLTGTLTLNTNFGLGVIPGASFSNGTYTVLHYGSVTDNSSGFSGWSASFTSVPLNLPSGQYYTTTFQNDAVHSNVNLVVSTSATVPTLPGGGSTTIVQSPNTPINNSNVNNPIVKIQNNNNTLVFLARAGQPAAKAFSFGWIPVVGVLPAGTPYFAAVGVQAGDPLQTGIPVSPDAPYSTNAPFDSPLTGPVGSNGRINGPKPYIGAVYPAGSIPIAAAPDDWLPVFFLAPLIVFADPPATPVPAYIGESYSNPNGDKGVYLAAQMNGEEALPTMLDSLADGADDQFNYQGSFLSLVQSSPGYSAITDLSQLQPSDWTKFDGSFGVNPGNSIAWSVNDLQDADFTVVAVGTATPEPSALAFLALSSAALFLRRRRAATA